MTLFFFSELVIKQKISNWFKSNSAASTFLLWYFFVLKTYMHDKCILLIDWLEVCCVCFTNSIFSSTSLFWYSTQVNIHQEWYRKIIKLTLSIVVGKDNDHPDPDNNYGKMHNFLVITRFKKASYSVVSHKTNMKKVYLSLFLSVKVIF